MKNLKPAEIIEALSKRKLEHWRTRSGLKSFIGSRPQMDFWWSAGKDTVSNEVLVKKYTAQEDVVFHAEISGAPFVVVKAEGKTISEQTLREAR